MTTLGIGLIGAGYMGKCHALAWNAVGATFGTRIRPRLVHLGETNADLASAKAAAFGFAHGSGDWRAVIDDPDVDIVSITTPNEFHAEMAIAVLGAGKHVWCEKPMATKLVDAVAMAEAAAGVPDQITALGYNYIQSPAFRQIETLVSSGRIGRLTHIRVEMDEDFMADPDAAFNWKHAASSGYGALGDFGVHPLSLLSRLVGMPSEVIADQGKPTAKRADGSGAMRPVETHDVASALMRFDGGLTGSLLLNRAAWGRKGRIQLQIMGTAGTIVFDQERAHEYQVYFTADGQGEQGFRTMLIGPDHDPYQHFVPAPGHGLGFNDLKIIEAHEILKRLDGAPARLIDFADGLVIERTIHALATSHAMGRWTATGAELGAGGFRPKVSASAV